MTLQTSTPTAELKPLAWRNAELFQEPCYEPGREPDDLGDTSDDSEDVAY